MKYLSYIIISILSLSILHTQADNRIDIHFTKDSVYWKSKFPAMSWNAGGTDYFVGQLNNYKVDDFSFKGAFGKFNPGAGNYQQPFNSEDFCEQFIYSFRIANSGNYYLELPEIADAGLLTLHCKSGNATAGAEFYIEKLVSGTWQRMYTLTAPPHGNEDRDAVIRQPIKSDTPIKLRVYGASKNLHVFALTVGAFDDKVDEGGEKEKADNIRFIVLPDTQNYSDEFPHIFHAQTGWIANHADSISLVMHVGDITNHNLPGEWMVAQDAMAVMDGKVPYTLCVGNRDMGTGGLAADRNTALFNQYFPYSKYSKVAGFGGVFEANKMDNSWFTLEHPSGYKFLVLSLEFAPRNEVIAWAKTIVEAHSLYNVIIVTHAYLYSDNQRWSASHGHDAVPDDYGFAANSSVNDGEALWTKLISLYANIKLVVSGHVLHSGTGTLVSEGADGNKVVQLLSNYQNGVDDAELGGSGYLRILDIDPEANLLQVRTYSPYLNEYKTEPTQQFSLNEVQLIKDGMSSVEKTYTPSTVKMWSSESKLFVKSNQSEVVHIRLFDMLGKLVHSQSVHQEASIACPKGCYMVQVDQEDVRTIQKVIIH